MLAYIPVTPTQGRLRQKNSKFKISPGLARLVLHCGFCFFLSPIIYFLLASNLQGSNCLSLSSGIKKSDPQHPANIYLV